MWWIGFRTCISCFIRINFSKAVCISSDATPIHFCDGENLLLLVMFPRRRWVRVKAKAQTTLIGQPSCEAALVAVRFFFFFFFFFFFSISALLKLSDSLLFVFL